MTKVNTEPDRILVVANPLRTNFAADEANDG
mgnify:CR=1 FL=1